MRNLTPLFAGSLVLLGLVAGSGHAQRMRPGSHPPVKPTPMMRPMPAQPPFVRATVGTFTSASGQFVPTLGGTSVLIARPGSFVPTTGTFVPSATGPFTLRTRETLNPATGTFTPSPTGMFSSTIKGTFVPAAGTYVKSTPGTFSPTTGAFTPATAGNFTLSGRGMFTPTSGTFVPHPGGPFKISTTEVYNPATGTTVPAANGQIVHTARGYFMPAGTPLNTPVGGTTPLPMTPFFDGSTPTLPVSNPAPPATNLIALRPRQPAPRPATPGVMPIPRYVPYPFYPPFSDPARWYMAYQNQLANSSNMLSLMIQTGFINPYDSWAGAWNPYAWNPYQTPMNYSYPYYPPPGGYGQGYSAPYAPTAAMPMQNAQVPPFNPPAAKPQQDPGLAALGLTTEGGAVQWPLAIRMMGPDQRRELLERLEAQLQIVGMQALAGKANPQVVDDARNRAVQVTQWLRSRRDTLPEATYREADAFLRQLDERLVALKG